MNSACGLLRGTGEQVRGQYLVNNWSQSSSPIAPPPNINPEEFGDRERLEGVVLTWTIARIAAGGFHA